MKNSSLVKFYIIFNMMLILFLSPVLNVWAEESYQSPKRILAVFSFKQGLPFNFHVEQSLRSAFTSDPSSNFILDIEHADQSRFPDKRYRSKLIDLYKYKYSQQKIDLVLAIGSESTDLFLEYGEELFANIPMVFVSTKSKILPTVAG